MQKERVIIFVPFVSAFGGVERLVVTLSRYLADRSIDHTIVSFRDTVDLSKFVSWKVAFHQLLPSRNFLSEAWVLRRFLRSHARYHTPLLFDLKSAFYSGILPAPPFVLHVTDPPHLLPTDVSKAAWSAGISPYERGAFPLHARLRAELVHRINKRGACCALHVVTTTNAIARELEALYGRHTEVVYPGTAVPKPHQTQSGACHRPKRLLSVCRLEASKRVDWIIRSVAELNRSLGMDLLLDIVGGGPEETRLKALASQLKLDKGVVFHGKLSDESLERLFEEASLFVMPALQGYGIPALEALVRDIPVVMHRDSGVSELMGKSPWVEIIQSGEAELQQAIRAMLSKIDRGVLTLQSKPEIPSEREWADAIGRLCGWIA